MMLKMIQLALRDNGPGEPQSIVHDVTTVLADVELASAMRETNDLEQLTAWVRDYHDMDYYGVHTGAQAEGGLLWTVTLIRVKQRGLDSTFYLTDRAYLLNDQGDTVEKLTPS